MIIFPLSIVKSIFGKEKIMEQTLFELIYNRGLRQTLLRSPLFFTEDFRNVPEEDLLHSADRYLLQNHHKLTKEFPYLYQAWQTRFPLVVESHIGLELTSSFQESEEYNEINYLKKNNKESEFFDNFLQFCQSFWHLVTEQSPRISKETIDNATDYHVHYYETTCKDLKGPHPKDMRTEYITSAELKEKMPDLLKIATIEKSIFFHCSTGDDLYDHTYGAKWLGRTLPLDFSKLD